MYCTVFTNFRKVPEVLFWKINAFVYHQENLTEIFISVHCLSTTNGLKCFWLVRQEDNFNTANNKCTNICNNAHLAWLENKVENNYIKLTYSSTNYMWIGARSNATNGKNEVRNLTTFQWVNGETHQPIVSPSDWEVEINDKSDGDICFRFVTSELYIWKDIPCDTKFPFLCQRQSEKLDCFVLSVTYVKLCCSQLYRTIVAGYIEFDWQFNQFL